LRSMLANEHTRSPEPLILQPTVVRGLTNSIRGVDPRRKSQTMQITDILAQAGGLQSIARELGVSESQATRGAEALAPAILGGFRKQADAQPAELEGLGGLLARLGGGDLLDNVLSPQPTDVSRGDNVLGEIFGSRDVSRAVAGNAAAQTGLDASLLKKMLPMLAMMVAGYMAKQQRAGAESAGSGLGGLLGGLLGGRPSGTGGLGGLAGMLEQDGNGNPLDDILRQVGRTSR